MKSLSSLFSILIITFVFHFSSSCTDTFQEDDNMPSNNPDYEGMVMQPLNITFDDAIEVFMAGQGEDDSRIMSLPSVEDLVVQVNVYDFWGPGPLGPGDPGNDWNEDGTPVPNGNDNYIKTAFFEYTYLLENPEIVVPLDPLKEVSIEVQARLMLSEEQVTILEEEGFEVERVEIYNSFSPPTDTDPVKTAQLLKLWQPTPPFFTDPAYSTTFFGAWSDMFMPDPMHPVDVFVDQMWGPQAFSFEVLNSNSTDVDVPGEISVAMAGGRNDAHWEENIHNLPDYLYTNEYVWWIKLLYTSPEGTRYLLASQNFEEYSWRRLVLFHLKLNIPELEFDDTGELTNFSSNSRTFFIELPEHLWHEEVVEIGG